MNKQRYWEIGHCIGLVGSKRTEEIDMCEELGIDEEELNEMSEDEIREAAEDAAEQFANDHLDIWAAPKE